MFTAWSVNAGLNTSKLNLSHVNINIFKKIFNQDYVTKCFLLVLMHL